MALTKKRILWVVFDFVQAGGQRYVFEICKSLNKEIFDVDVLKVAEMGHDKNWNSEFYYEPTVALGCTVYSIFDLIPQASNNNSSLSRRLANRIQRTFNNPPFEDQETLGSGLKKFFSKYDVVNFSGSSVYNHVCIGNGIRPPHAIIHLLTARFQEAEVYNGFDKSAFYRFVSAMTSETLKHELEGFTNYSFTYYPLCFETTPYSITSSGTQKLKIAIFTRLSSMKPLDPFFYAFKLLLERGLDVHLDVYGAGDPVQLGMIRQLKYLYIADRVSFKGHRDSIVDTLTKDVVDLIWFQSGNRQPLGYAAFEISMSGIPQIFWDFMDVGETNPIEAFFPSFVNLTEFVNFSAELLENGPKRKEIGQKQRDYVIEHNSNLKHIHILETLFTHS